MEQNLLAAGLRAAEFENLAGWFGRSKRPRNWLRKHCMRGSIVLMFDHGGAEPSAVAALTGQRPAATLSASLTQLAEVTGVLASVSLFGVSDLALMVADTHRFEATYLDALVAPWPAGASVYEERSPMRQLDQISAPMLVFQGAADTVVPMDQSRLLGAGLKDRGIPVEYHEFRNEGHGFKEPATLRTVMETELAFYLRELGL